MDLHGAVSRPMVDLSEQNCFFTRGSGWTLGTFPQAQFPRTLCFEYRLMDESAFRLTQHVHSHSWFPEGYRSKNPESRFFLTTATRT
jgi:hypothetical protein